MTQQLNTKTGVTITNPKTTPDKMLPANAQTPTQIAAAKDATDDQAKVSATSQKLGPLAKKTLVKSTGPKQPIGKRQPAKPKTASTATAHKPAAAPPASSK